MHSVGAFLEELRDRSGAGEQAEDILAEKLHISKEQMQYVTNSGQGEGLIRYDKVLLPFTDTFPTDTEMYKLMTTKPTESA